MTRQKVDVIPASVRSVQNGGQLKSQTNIRVAAYCRVSTGDESQQTSYTTQKAFYKDLITRKPGWIFAGIYADEAKSGTNREHREEFNRMIKDAMDGKLDYIVTKSISRFARNTIDSLTCTRELRQLKPPVGIYFEKENIDTLLGLKEIKTNGLLAYSGGIVQGMSGSPIIQNNRLIGAVTHVFVNNPTKGYGIFAEWMVREAEKI